MTIRFFHQGKLTDTLSGGRAGARWRIGKGGGGEDVDLLLPAHPLASRNHALLYVEGGAFFLEDAGSTNGTFVNGLRLPPGAPRRLAAGDVIHFGSTGLEAIAAAAAPASHDTVLVQLNELQRVFRDGRPGVGPLSLVLREGSFTGIMGPSGCGKSTLLRVLAGVDPPTAGGLTIGGYGAQLHPGKVRRLTGYVPQQDLLYPCLTVYEQLRFTARLRLPLLDGASTESRINRSLDRLHLSELRLRAISSLSGGQRKRVAIAAELLAEPPLLLLDEPTSPLDPHSADNLRGILQELCESGTTVVMVTHRPEDFGQLDSLLALGKGGQPLYFGPPQDYLRYFGASEAPAVYRLLNHPGKEPFGRLSALFRQSASAAPVNLDAEPRRLPPGSARGEGAGQLRWLLARAFRQKLSDRRALLLFLLQAPVIAMLIGLIFPQISVSVLFLLSLAAVWLGISNAAREVVEERAIYEHERLYGLRIPAYLLSKLVLLAVPALLQAMVFVLVLALRYASATPSLSSPVQLAAWLFGLTLAATTLGLAASAHARSTEQVTAAAPLLLLPQILLGGVLTGISSGLVECLSWITFARWGTEGLSNIQQKATADIQLSAFEGIQMGSIEGNARELLQSQYLPAYTSGNIFGTWTGSLGLDAGMLAVLSGVLLAVMALGLRRKLR